MIVWFQTLRLAARSLSRRPAFAATSIVMLALGIGAIAATFSVVDAVLIRALPYPNADRVVVGWGFSEEVQQRLGLDRLPTSPADVNDYQTRQTAFEHLSAIRAERVNVTGGGDPERIGAVRVTAPFFDVFGVRPVVGRTFGPGDEAAARTVVISEGLWSRRYGSDPAIVGRTILLNGEAAQVVGVLPGTFGFPAVGDVPEGLGFSLEPDVWTLEVMTPQLRQNRGGKSWILLGRLGPGVSIEQAEADLAAIASDIARDFPRSNAGWTVRLISLREQLVARIRPALMALLLCAACVLLTACANIANLSLVRVTSRQRDLAIRGALGATRGQIIREVMAEGLLIAAAGAVAGLVFARVAITTLLLAAPAHMPALGDVGIDVRVIAFTTLISLLAGLAVGLVPALHATRRETVNALRDGGRGASGKGRRLRAAIVMLEVAFAVLLLIGVALIVQTFVRLSNVPTGFSSARVLTLDISLSETGYEGDAIGAFFDRLVERIAVLPGVEAAGATSGLPLAGPERLVQVTRAGEPRPDPGREMIADYRAVSPGYFSALLIPLLQGNGLPEQASSQSLRAVVINQTMARAGWPGQSPLGRQIKLAAYDQDAPWYTVVGVVGDTRLSRLDQTPRPAVFADNRQVLNPRMAIVIRTSGDPAALVGPARAAIAATDASQAVGQVRTMDQIFDASIAARRFQMYLIGVFAALAVILALVGLYAVVSASVAERKPEMSIRAAIGARPVDLLRLVLVEGLQLVAVGALLGLSAAWVLTRFLEALLFDVGARDTTTFVVAPLALAIVAIAACLLPARRAMTVDPARALRAD